MVVFTIVNFSGACGSDDFSFNEQENIEVIETNVEENEGEVVELVVKAKNYYFDQAEYIVPLVHELR